MGGVCSYAALHLYTDVYIEFTSIHRGSIRPTTKDCTFFDTSYEENLMLADSYHTRRLCDNWYTVFSSWFLQWMVLV